MQLRSLKRKTTTMAKRQSFIMEAKPLHTNELMKEQSKLSSKFSIDLLFFFLVIYNYVSIPFFH